MQTIAAREEIELAKLPIAGIQDVLLARMVARQEAARLGFAPRALTQIATAVSEIGRNVVQHACASGQVIIADQTEGSRRGLKITVQDTGSGIADLDRALLAGSPGAGIPGSRKLMDEFAIRCGKGSGTTVTMVKWLSRE
jgi:anti-sigma regulatory factor (Ser/Thr protein kinase)